MTHSDILKSLIWKAVYWSSLLPFVVLEQNEIDSFLSYNKVYKQWGQCVAYVRHYALLRGWTLPPMHAVQYSKMDISGFKFIPSTPTNYPKEGDLVIWNEKRCKNGHIAIANSLCNPMVLRCSDQNGWVGTGTGKWKDAIQNRWYTYKNVVGWLTKI